LTWVRHKEMLGLENYWKRS